VKTLLQMYAADIAQEPGTLPATPNVAPLKRMRALCLLLGLSDAKEKDIDAGSMAAAKACIRSGEVYLETPYADGIDKLLPSM